MKKYYLILLLFLLASGVKAQTNVYHPFPKDSAVWFYIFQNGSTPPSTSYNFTEWLGDTIINSISYKKIYTKQNSSSYSYSGGVRQDIANEKIYKIGLTGVEQDVSVNQHLVVGDTLNILPCNGAMIIIKVDSVMVGANFNKRYNLKCTDSIAAGTYIVGVGEEGWSVTEYADGIACFSVNNINQFGSAPYCKVISVDELSNENKIVLSPNPFTSSASLQSTIPLHNATLTVYNSQGQKVKEIKNITGLAVTVQRDNLPVGLYFLRLTEDNKTFATEKLIITD